MSDERRTVIEGLAAIATSLAEAGMPEPDAHAQLVAWIERLGVDAATVRAAAAEVARQPQPLEETAEETERARPIREMLGVTSAEDQLIAALRAREWLEQLADERAN